MYPDLIARLRQDIRKLNRNEVYLIRDYALADGSFLLYHFISLFLRGGENGRVFLLALNQTINAYKIVLAKLGVQLQRQIDQNRCRFLDFSHVLSLSKESAETGTPWFQFKNVNEIEKDEAMKHLYLHIKGEIEEMIASAPTSNSGSKPPFLVVIDSLSTFIDFRIPLKAVVHFLHYLRHFGQVHNISFAVLTKTDEKFQPVKCDDVLMSAYEQLASYLFSWGSISFEKALVFDVKTLATGWSQDVHGEVTIREIKTVDDQSTQVAEETETRLLFRLGDRNVSFMAPGLVPRIGV